MVKEKPETVDQTNVGVFIASNTTGTEMVFFYILLEYFVFKVDLPFYFYVVYRNYMYTDVFLHIFKDGLRMSVDAKFNKYILHVHFINTTYCII